MINSLQLANHLWVTGCYPLILHSNSQAKVPNSVNDPKIEDSLSQYGAKISAV